jgi:hypothetical protein
MMIVRAPVVAGSFYELDASRLRKQVEACFKHELGPKGFERKDLKAAIVPHAGYLYSGPIAAWVYSRVPKANYIILGPNHHGLGASFATMKEALWKTPLGGVAVHTKLAELLVRSPLIEVDVLAHQSEHSIEVQLPFLQYRFGDEFKFVPICVANEFADKDFLGQCELVARCLASAIKRQKERWVLLASSDLTHYAPQEIASSVDDYVLGAVLKMDANDFFARINEKAASWCGFGAIAIAMLTAKELGARRSELLKYATSGDVTKDYAAVVGYAAVIFS